MRRFHFVVTFVRGLLLTIGLLVLLATCTPLPRWYLGWLAHPWNDYPGTGTLIVPAASMEAPHIMGLGTFRRLFYAHYYWQRGHYQYIVVLGQHAAPAMRDWLIYHGVPAQAILWEDQSTTTRENALAAQRLLAAQPTAVASPLVLVTSDYHVRRCRRAFAAVGINVLPCPVPDAGKRWENWLQRWPVAVDLAIETASLAEYLRRGWLAP